MNITQTLPLNTLQSMKRLAERHPVYLLTLSAGACIIKKDDLNSNRASSAPTSIMQAKANLMDLEGAMKGRDGNNKADVKKITEKLRAAGGLEKIGEIGWLTRSNFPRL